MNRNLLILLVCMATIFVSFNYAEWKDRFSPAKQVSLGDVIDKPETWFNVPIEIPVRFAWLSDIYVPYRTKFSQDRFVNFTAWDVQEQIWESQGFNRTHPYFYMEKDNPELQAVLKLKTFDTVCLLAKVEGVFGGKPFIRVVWAYKTPGELNIINLRMINQALKFYQQRQFDEALDLFSTILKTHPPHDIQTMVHKAIARIYIYEKRTYEYAFFELKKAQLLSPHDAEVAEIFAECRFFLGVRADELETSWNNGALFIPRTGTTTYYTPPITLPPPTTTLPSSTEIAPTDGTQTPPTSVEVQPTTSANPPDANQPPPATPGMIIIK